MYKIMVVTRVVSTTGGTAVHTQVVEFTNKGDAALAVGILNNQNIHQTVIKAITLF